MLAKFEGSLMETIVKHKLNNI